MRKQLYKFRTWDILQNNGPELFRRVSVMKNKQANMARRLFRWQEANEA